MKQYAILTRIFKIDGQSGLFLCVNTLSDDKLNVKGIHYIKVNKEGKFNPKEEWSYIGGKDLAKIQVYEDLSGPYFPGATLPVRPLDTMVPDSMDFEIHSAVATLKETVGSINSYVRTKLKYASDEEMAKALGAEQVDAIAMGIYNIEEKGQSLIIGDQTGIGKGRVAAGIIRYGALNGKKPIFVTEKPNLFSDMYRDLTDIGNSKLVPFIMNNKEAKTLIKDYDGNVIYEPPAKNIQDKIINSQKLPAEYDYIMATYSQFSSEKPTAKQAFLSALSNGNILILDESHNAGGNLEISNTARFFYNCVENSQGCVFLSATFAKRPDNMPLYAMKTAMSEASMSNNDLVAAIQKGGVALQEVLASNLVAEGQMIRRERSFEGIEVNYITLDVNGAKNYGVPNKEEEHKAIADNITGVLRKIISFQEDHISAIVSDMDEGMKGEQGEVAERQGTKNLGVDNPPYFSKLFNVINQMLFSIKAEAVADRAIARLREGKKPVIAFSSTMAAFLEQMENEAGDIIADGGTVNTDFSEVLRKGLEGVLRISITDGYGKSEKKQINIADLKPEGQAIYYQILNQIKNISTGISISPIDVIKNKLQRAGFSVAEVTGRKLEVQLEQNSMKGLVLRRKKENTNDAFRRFNNNEVDVLMINQSGSTGASAHAVPTPLVPKENVKQRCMIMLQAELDINREVQKRGRINRTGQIIKPVYDYVYSAIPAEKRFAMMLQKKLKSLDANTTSNQKNSEELMKSDDFLNKYGDKIVVAFLQEEENWEFNTAIGDPLGLDDSDSEKEVNVENAAHRVSGRVAVLPTSEQERFYNEILSRYTDLVKYLIDTGEYDLEVESLDLQAETIDRKIAVAGQKGGKSSFAGNTYLEECMINNLKQPFSKTELVNSIALSLNNRTSEDIQAEQKAEIELYFKGKYEKDVANEQTRWSLIRKNITNEAKYKKLTTDKEKRGYIQNRKAEIDQSEEKSIQNIKEKANNNFKYLMKYVNYFTIGKPLIFPYQEMDYKAVFLGFSIDKNKPNPYAPSAIKAKIAISNSLKVIQFALSGEQGDKLAAIIGSTESADNSEVRSIIEDWTLHCEASSATRKKAFIYTNNVLQAFSVASSGKLISYTTIGGDVKKGIIMPDGWKQETVRGSTRTVVPLTSAIRVIMGLMDGQVVITSNNVTIMRTYKGYRLITNSMSVQKFGWLLKNEELLKYITNYGGFQKQSSAWIGDFDVENLKSVVNIIYNITKATVELSDSQVEIIASELEDDSTDYNKTEVFPRLLELEIKLFKLLKNENISFSGLGLPANALEAFEILKKSYPIQPKNENEKKITQMIKEVAVITDNFSNPTVIGINRVDVKSMLEKEKITPGEWLAKNKTLRRSESDVIEWLAETVQKMLNKTNRIDERKDIELAEAEAEAMLMELELLNL